jgi:hypothetical protein
MGKTVTGGFALVLLAGGLSVATAQPQGRGQRSTPQEVQRGITVETRPRPDYDPLGVRLGGFRLDGFVEAGMGYDSNIFATKDNVKSDGYAQESGTVQLSSDWTRHAVGASAIIDSRQYLSRSDLNWTDWSVGFFGRYDIDPRSNVDFRYRHYKEHLDVYNFDVQSAGISKPVPFDSDEVQVSGSTRFNRLGLTAIGLYRTFRYEDTDIGGVRQLTSDRNFDTVIGNLGASYAFTPGRYVTATVRLQDIAYEKSISRGRDSFTWVALLGFEYDFDGVWAGRIGVGYQQRQYNSPLIKTLEAPAFEGRLSWSPTQLTTVTLAAVRTLEESIRADETSYIRTSAGIRVDHEYLRNVLIGGEIRADRREYGSDDASATDGVVQLNSRWLLNRSLSLVGTYAYTTRLAATGQVDTYDRHLVQLRLRVAL